MSDNFEFGQVRISSDVVASIANIAVEEIEGFKVVKTLVNKVSNKNQSIKVSFNDKNELVLSVNVVALYGLKMQDEVPKVQDNVITNIEIMTGLKVAEVNVNISSLYFNNENK